MTGMSRRSMRRRSISKQRGAEISSKLIAPKEGAKRAMVSTSSSTSCVSRTMGTDFRPANALNSCALPSMTGREACGPISPRPKTAEPSEITATVLPTPVCVRATSGSTAIASHTLATPGVYAKERSRISRKGRVEAIESLPPACASNISSSVRF